MEKVITGNWNGEPIWRQKTAGEQLAELLEAEQYDKESMQREEETGRYEGLQDEIDRRGYE